MPIAHTLKTAILDAAAYQRKVADSLAAEAQAVKARKEAEETSRRINQKLLDELRKSANKSTLRVVELDGKAYLLNGNASPNADVVTELAAVEREASQ